MPVWVSALWALHWGCIVGLAGLAIALVLMTNQQRIHARERQRDKRFREEFEAYARFDPRTQDGDMRSLAKRICRLIAQKSAFQRVAMLARDSAGRVYVAGSIGMDELTIAALEAEAGRLAKASTARLIKNSLASHDSEFRLGERSFAVGLGKEAAAIGCGRAVVIPVWAPDERIAGALAVCADRLMTLPHQIIEETISPLETLAIKLGRAMEENAPAGRPRRAEKSSGAGRLASDVARELSNPLTAVLGFAELIAETTSETRVRSDAEMIMQEARRMQQTVRNLQHFGRGEGCLNEPVEIGALVRDTAAECEQKLAERGVRLAVQAEDDLPVVHGSAERLRRMLEHLLNNAAHAVASSSEKEIQVSVNHDARSLQMIVSDTGPGFPDPGQAFHTPQALRIAGCAETGLVLCNEIVREHGGEINAFNLHPYGAAVVVELPLRERQDQPIQKIAREVA